MCVIMIVKNLDIQNLLLDVRLGVVDKCVMCVDAFS